MKPFLVLIITLALSFLMVSTIKYRSFKDMKFRGGQHITYLVWGILTLMLLAAWPQVMLFVIFAGYALLGPAERLVGLFSKVAGKRPLPKTEQPVNESKV